MATFTINKNKAQSADHYRAGYASVGWEFLSVTRGECPHCGAECDVIAYRGTKYDTTTVHTDFECIHPLAYGQWRMDPARGYTR